MDQATKNSMRALDQLVANMSRKGYVFVLLVGSKVSEVDGIRLRLGTTIDVMKAPELKGAMTRMLRDTADILERGEGDLDIEVV